jgi:hypothetical protein
MSSSSAAISHAVRPLGKALEINDSPPGPNHIGLRHRFASL